MFLKAVTLHSLPAAVGLLAIRRIVVDVLQQLTGSVAED